ncbi:MAG: Spy/CpxP family protein refolding chaperone [Salinisphaera sp.]
MQAAPWFSGVVLAAVLSSTALAHNGMMGDTDAAMPGQSASNPDSQASNNAQMPPQPQSFGYGPGMMYGYGPGAMMSGYGPMMMWNGYGPAGSHGYGPGMMSGYGYGMPGYGAGMMYGYGGGAGSTLNLNAKQRQSLGKLWQTQANQQRQLQEQLYQDMSRMRALMASENPDPNAVGQVYDHMAATRRQLLVNGIRMRNKFENLLTPEQRTHWRQNGPWCAGGVQQNGGD